MWLHKKFDILINVSTFKINDENFWKNYIQSQSINTSCIDFLNFDKHINKTI